MTTNSIPVALDSLDDYASVVNAVKSAASTKIRSALSLGMSATFVHTSVSYGALTLEAYVSPSAPDSLPSGSVWLCTDPTSPIVDTFAVSTTNLGWVPLTSLVDVFNGPVVQAFLSSFEPSALLDTGGNPYPSFSALEAARPAATHAHRVSAVGANWSTAVRSHVELGTWRVAITYNPSTNTITNPSAIEAIQSIPGFGGSTDEVKVATYLTDLTGTVSQRTQLLQAMTETAANGTWLVIDRPVYVDIAAVGEEIIVPNGTKLRFKGAGVIKTRMHVNPTFMFIHGSYWMENPTFVYTGIGLSATDHPGSGILYNTAIQSNIRLKQRLIADWGVTFGPGMDPNWNGYNPFHAMLLLQGGAKLYVKGKLTLKALDGVPCTQFIPYALTSKAQPKPGSVNPLGTNYDFNTCDAATLIADELEIDGALMGVQGGFERFEVGTVRGGRWSDMMDPSGGNIGGVSNYFPPPHLFYFDNGWTKVIDIGKVFDEGAWVTTNADPRARRASGSGNCSSCKIGSISPLSRIGFYRSLRGDGGLEFLGGDGRDAITVQSFYIEYDSSLSDGAFPGVRWPGSYYRNVKLYDGIIRDVATLARRGALGTNWSNTNERIVIKNVECIYNDFDPNVSGVASLYAGKNHDIDITHRILNHTSTQTGRGFLVAEGSQDSSLYSSRIRMAVFGWRNFYSDVNGLKTRLLLNGTASGVSPGTNRLDFADVNNGHTMRADGLMVTERWNQKVTVSAPTGASVSPTMKIPANWTVVAAVIKTKVALGATGGTTGYTVGWSGTPAGLGTVAVVTTAGNVVNTTPIASTGSDRTIVITPTGGNFDGTGLIEISLVCELVRVSE